MRLGASSARCGSWRAPRRVACAETSFDSPRLQVLFDHEAGWRDAWLHPELRAALQSGSDEALRGLLEEVTEGVYRFPMLTAACCQMLIDEVDGYAASGLPTGIARRITGVTGVTDVTGAYGEPPRRGDGSPARLASSRRGSRPQLEEQVWRQPVKAVTAVTVDPNWRSKYGGNSL